jgi:hypothetical protein
MFVKDGLKTRYFGNKVGSSGTSAILSLPQLEILKSIVRFITILMMHYLIFLERPIKTKCNNKTMLKNSWATYAIFLRHSHSDSLLFFWKTCYDKCYIAAGVWLSRIRLLVTNLCWFWWIKFIPAFSAKSSKANFLSYRSPDSGWSNISFLFTRATDDCDIIGVPNFSNIVPENNRIVDKVYILGLNWLHDISPFKNPRRFDYTLNNRGCV